MKNRNLLKISVMTLLIILPVLSLKAQEEYDHVFCDETFALAEILNAGESYHYKATKSIELKHGFSYTAAGDKMARFEVSKDFSVDDNSMTDITLYPNPAGDKIRFTTEKDAVVRIINVQGVTIVEKCVSEGDNEIDISTLPSGIYMVRVVTEHGALTKEVMKM